MAYRYSANSDWGDLYGLEPTDLDDNQLSKIKYEKLIEFASKDPRVEKIVGDKVVKSNIAGLAVLNKFIPDELTKMPYLVSQYNKCIRERCNELEADEKSKWSFNRSSYMFWNILDKNNKSKELNRWLNDSTSVVRPAIINYTWLYDNYKWIADNVVEKVLHKSSTVALINMVTGLPKEPTEKYIERIFDHDRSIYAHALTNENTPRKYIIKALREIAGKKRIPSLNVKLDKSILSELPPVMRLRTLESLFLYMNGGRVSFTDIKTEDDIKPLLFCTAIRYNARVNNVVKRFNYLYT